MTDAARELRRAARVLERHADAHEAAAYALRTAGHRATSPRRQQRTDGTMIQGLVWLSAITGAICMLAWLLPRAVIPAVAAWKRRNVEPPTKEPPSAACLLCGGTWSKWSAVIAVRRPNDPIWPLSSGSHEVRAQTRTCNDCGVGERRVLG